MSVCKLITAPATEPLTTAEAKTHLRVDSATDDTYIGTLITAARQYVEGYLGRALITQTWDLTLDAWPIDSSDGFYESIIVPSPPLVSITHVKYYDTSGTLITAASSTYAVDVNSTPGRITPVYGTVWPSAQFIPNAITVRFVTGYGAAADVPAAIKQAMLLLIAQFYEYREEVVAGTIVANLDKASEFLLRPHRITRA